MTEPSLTRADALIRSVITLIPTETREAAEKDIREAMRLQALSSLSEGWVSVEERLPPFKRLVLVLDHDVGGATLINLGRLENSPPPYEPQWHLRKESWETAIGPRYQRITHWRDLPSPPVEKD